MSSVKLIYVLSQVNACTQSSSSFLSHTHIFYASRIYFFPTELIYFSQPNSYIFLSQPNILSQPNACTFSANLIFLLWGVSCIFSFVHWHSWLVLNLWGDKFSKVQEAILHFTEKSLMANILRTDWARKCIVCAVLWSCNCISLYFTFHSHICRDLSIMSSKCTFDYKSNKKSHIHRYHERIM